MGLRRSTRARRAVRLPGRGGRGCEFTEGAVVAVPSSRLPAATDFLAQVGMKSALLVPLVSRDERIGVLLLASRLRDLLDPDWSAFAQTIGAQISQTVGLGRVFARLAAAEERYRGLFENAAEGIFQTSVEGRALIANPALARILGYDSPEELVARVTDVARQLYTDPARRDELLRRVREEGAVSGFEMPARRKDRSTVWLSVSARAVRGPDGTVLHLEGRAEDITARKRAQETAAALAEVGRELVATVDFAQVAERVVSTVARVFQVRRAGLYRLDPVSRALTCIAIAGEGDPGPWLGRVLPFGAGPAGRAVAEERAAPSPDIPTDSPGPLPEWLVERFQAEGLRAGAGAPLIARGKTLGALDLADRAGRVFTGGELGLLSVFADQAAAALQNAELYEEAERRRHAAEVLADLGRLVSQSLDLTEVRQRVVDGVRELLGGHSAALLRIDQESGDLVTTAASGEREIFGVTPVLPRGTGASGLAVRERRPVASPDMLADDRFTVSAEIRTLAERASCRAVLAVPLSMQERVVGVLNVSGRTGRIFGEEEVHVVEAFAAHAAVALENAQLYEDARAARDFLRSIATNSADAIITTDVRGRTTYFSPGAEEMLGYHAGEVLGRPLAQFYRSGVEEGRALMRRLWTEGRIQHYESAFRGKDGRWVEVSASVSLLRDADGRVTGTVGVLRDVTEPKGAAEALRESEERFRRAFDDSGIGMALQTMDGRYLRVNRVYCEMVGYTAEELLAVSFRDVLHPEDQAADVERDRRMLSGEVGHYQREKRYRHKSGRVVWVLSSVSLVRDADGRPRNMLVQVQDVTERKRIEAELEQQREARLQSDKLAAMGQLLAGVAHELNNPLSVVMGRAALLSRALEGGPLAAQADQIGQAAERCARIVKNFLALARHRAPERGRVAIGPLVQEAIELLAYPLRVDSVEVVVDLAPDLPALWADGHQLHQVLVNLITNAHHALRGAPAPRRLTLTASADPGQSRVAIEVADTGPGIPPEVLSRLFEPFFTTKPPGQGTGLGLSLCRGIVEEHAGSITVESGVGQGARFRIELPVTAPEAEREEPAVARRAAVRGKSILVVDDEADVAEVLAEILALDDHEVDVTLNGQVALDRILEKPYDLVFSDVRMPELDGPGLYQRLEELRHGLVRRFVFLTGDVLGPETRAFLERTGAPSVSKPFAASEIRRVLRRMLLPGDQREPQ
ncbi:MAG: hypothetical protein DMD79_03950 [Candidatus Rokuibacteriota bacterium]|nr:MAG: hypothetical protein DMD79_03950 [Candidatus Rokubacteria bacterium]